MAILVGALIAVVVGARILTDVWWFDQLGFLSVFTKRLWLQIGLFLAGGTLMAAAVGVTLSLAYRSRPIYAPISTEQAGLDRYRESLEPLRRLVTLALSLGAGLFGATVASAQWETALLWWNRVEWGTTDPQFQLDYGFYVFTLPWIQFVVSFLTAVVVLAGIAALATHYLYGGLRLAGGGPRTTREARIHLALLGAAFLLLRGVGYWLDRYQLMTSESANVSIRSVGVVGPTYTDVNAVLPAKAILAVASILVAMLFIAAAAGASWRLPAAGTTLLVISAVAVGGIYPAAVQRFRVQPSAATVEAPFLERNIEATRAAYDLADTQVNQYIPDTEAQPGQLRNDAGTIPGIRLLDPALLSPTYRQLEQVRPYYAFPDALDVDRYRIDGVVRDTVIAPREVSLRGLNPSQRNWINDHTVYTHGYGMVGAYGNERTPDGRPVFFERGLSTSPELGEYQPRIYFGEQSPAYSIVGAGEGAPPTELDYPNESPEGYARNTYEGEGGVRMGSFFARAAYAINFADQNILLSDRVNPQSRIMYDRHPRERVEKVAPWLTLDGDPYAAVVGDRIVWIIDAYTTTADYPYSATTELGEATQDTRTGNAQSVQALQDRTVNYVRNSVKATVDAYDGKVTLYAWDEEDPMLKAWMKAFPTSVEPLSAISGDLMQHLRYPQDMFKVQRDVLGRYHVTDPQSFYTQQDFWEVPNDPTGGEADAAAEPPYYLTLRMPGQEDESFSLTSTYIPRQTGANQRNVLTGYLAVDADAGGVEGEKREGYGTMRLLQLPRETAVSGPGQVQANIVSSPLVANEIRLLSQGESQVLYGNLLTLPVGGGFLYVEPVYGQSRSGVTYPQLRKVAVVFGDKIGFANTLPEALDQVFGGDSGVATPDLGEPGPEGPEGEPGVPPDAQAQLDTALQDARKAIQDSAAALQAGDFAAYGEAQERLGQAVDRAIAAEDRIAAATGAPAEGADVPAEGAAAPTDAASPAADPEGTATAGS
ncbi:hypothetical protein CLV92_101444 [Kineococcus xinjiangensis]|uniref:UPF0182 protein CLV92_101444 n=1 Tax=Kineococcus xinjiangensis TaxID=512762 RepID=A0A2S6IWN1_9ACTN|nr:hypothetical protein CLV92_101444 [Kineococcus xinjiangensis]